MYGNAGAHWPLLIRPPQTQTKVIGFVERTSLFPGGDVWFEFFQTSEKKLLRFPLHADFTFDPDALSQGISAIPSPDTDLHAIEHLFHNNVVPMLLADSGALMLHGAAVDLGDGAVVFIGLSGRGKSTLAASFASAGLPFLSDDSIRLDPRGTGYIAQPSYPSIRLRRDSDEAILCARTSDVSSVTFSNKARYAAGSEIPHSTKPTPLRAIYVLEREGVTEINIQRLNANEAVMEFVQHSFNLDIRSEATLSGHFERMATLANKASVFRLDYPRDYGLLPDIRSAIVDHAMSLT